MIRDELTLIVLCDDCGTALSSNPTTGCGGGSGGEPARFSDRVAALTGIEAATAAAGGWGRRLDGRLLCPGCASESLCLLHGHDFRDRSRGGEDGSYGWRVCACRRSISEHVDAPVDPAGGDGCGMAWRLCGRCDHIEELHVTDDLTDESTGELSDCGRAGGVAGCSRARAGARGVREVSV